MTILCSLHIVIQDMLVCILNMYASAFVSCFVNVFLFKVLLFVCVFVQEDYLNSKMLLN